MATIYGYARCSTNEDLQDIDRQKRELKKMGVEDDKYIYWEYESGMKKDRAELQKLFDIVKPGDTIITMEVSRLTQGLPLIYAKFLKLSRIKSFVLSLIPSRLTAERMK